MDQFFAFLHMGGYSGFIWPAYGAAVILLIALLAASVRTTRRQERALAALQASRPRRARQMQASVEG